MGSAGNQGCCRGCAYFKPEEWAEWDTCLHRGQAETWTRPGRTCELHTTGSGYRRELDITVTPKVMTTREPSRHVITRRCIR